MPFKEFEFRGFLGKRRVVSYGWRYDFNHGGLQRTEDMPDFVQTIGERTAAFAGLPAPALQQVLLTEYRPGAAIGWHKDRSVFGEVVGLSLLSPCTFHLRRRVGQRWERRSLEVKDEATTTWVEPKLVDEVKFTEWTAAGEMRHPAFLGLREDKRAEDVVREKEAARKRR